MAKAVTKTQTGKNSSSLNSNKTSESNPSKRKPHANESEEGGSLYKFFVDSLRDIYWVEKNLIPALQRLENAATTSELKEAFEDHLLLTQKHAFRLEKVFNYIEEEPKEKKCEAMEGLFKEAEEIIKSTEDGSMTRDAALIIAAQKAEHYEIASYGGLVALARTMKFGKIADLLERTLKEEEQTDADLTHIGETKINFQSAEENAFYGEDEADSNGAENTTVI